MKHFVVCAFLMMYLMPAFCQIIVRNVVEKSFEKLDYPNHMGNNRSSEPQKGTLVLKDGTRYSGKLTFFKLDGKLVKVKVHSDGDKHEIEGAQIGSVKLDPEISEQKHPNDYKNPEKNFQRGYMITTEGVKISGKIAQNRSGADYDFFVYSIFFLPEGSSVASTIRGGAVNLFVQEINGHPVVWDGYADGYVKRLVDGRYRLWRNPYSSAKNEFLTSLKTQSVDSVKREEARRTLEESLQSGHDINASIENAVNGVELGYVLGALQINKKEYLIFDTRAKNVRAINKDIYHEFADGLFSHCPGHPTDTEVTKDLLSWDKIETFVKYINEHCN